MTELGKKLRTLRAEKGYTQEKIADMLGIPQATYSNLENNKGKVDLKLLEKGDLIIYSYNGEITKYSVDEIGIIKDTDWSKLQNSKQDKLTLITCLEDKPEYRRYVQAIKI